MTTAKARPRNSLRTFDNASNAHGGALNFFGTTKATGTVYAAGDSRGDVAGARVTTDTLGAAVLPYFKATPG